MRWYQRFFRRGLTEKHLDAELRFHLDQKIADLEASGMSREDARRRAQIEFGGLEQVKEECRDVGAAHLLETLIQDLHYGLRMLAKNPSFTLVAVLTLALGIGGNTAIFSAVDTLLLRPLPYPNADRIVVPHLTLRSADGSFYDDKVWSYPKYELLRADNHVFEYVAGYRGIDANVSARGEPQRVKGELASANYFLTLGVNAILGRTFLPEEDRRPQGQAVVLLSYRLWQTAFGGNAGAIAQSISLDDRSFTVVGILPKGFRGLTGTADFWIPLTMAPAVLRSDQLDEPQSHWFYGVARLRSGISYARADADLSVVNKRIVTSVPSMGTNGEWGIYVVSLKQDRIDPVLEKSLVVLLAAVGLVLLIGCANVANLLLGRATQRRKEIAMRLALGAGRSRLIRQLLTESAVLALLGGAAALSVAWWATGLLSALGPENAPVFHLRYAVDFTAIHIDARVLTFNFLLAAVTGVIFGLIPAIHAARTGVNETLREGDAVRRLRRLGLRAPLIVGEVALALVLLAAAGLLIRSFARMVHTNLGFRADHLLTFKVSLPPKTHSPAAQQRFYETLTRKLQALPGIESAGLADAVPLSGHSSVCIGTRVGDENQPSDRSIGVEAVTPDHFHALGISILRGRGFSSSDRPGSPTVALINQTAARRFWPNENPLGKRINVSIDFTKENPAPAEIVGVVGDVKYESLDEPVMAEAYLPQAQEPDFWTFVVVRSKTEPTRLISAVRHTVASVDKNLPVYNVETMDRRISGALSRGRFNALLLGAFAVLALMLATVGLFGVLSYIVAQRTHEIGIRMALGAQRNDVLRLVVGQGMMSTLIGMGVGIFAALGLTRFLSSLLYGVKPTDPMTIVFVSTLLTVVALIACYIPARRATKVDPMVALRHE